MGISVNSKQKGRQAIVKISTGMGAIPPCPDMSAKMAGPSEGYKIFMWYYYVTVIVSWTYIKIS